jgi:hypothetical protein
MITWSSSIMRTGYRRANMAGEVAVTEDLNRRFGVDTNNETWKLLDEGPPGPDAPADERELFLYRAYASAFHWRQTDAATPANVARGEHLIARAAIAVGLPDVGLRHATRCLELCQTFPEAMEDWDPAFAEEAIARAHAAAGDLDEARSHRQRAAALGAAIAEDDDREVFLSELAREPWFGLTE